MMHSNIDPGRCATERRPRDPFYKADAQLFIFNMSVRCSVDRASWALSYAEQQTQPASHRKKSSHEY
jgi:hypothetical protein